MSSGSHQILTLVLVLFAACSRTEKPGETSVSTAPATNTVQTNQPISSQSAPLNASLANVQTSLKGGAFDEAAAQLLKMRAAGQEFSQKDGAAYREALSEAYSRALEAASKGDPKAKAAVQMLRAAHGR